MGAGRTPTVHRCPKGKVVGGPQQTTSDERPSDNDMPRTNVLSGKQVQTDVLSAKTGVDRHLYTCMSCDMQEGVVLERRLMLVIALKTKV